jgi:hypothetical protein
MKADEGAGGGESRGEVGRRRGSGGFSQHRFARVRAQVEDERGNVVGVVSAKLSPRAAVLVLGGARLLTSRLARTLAPPSSGSRRSDSGKGRSLRGPGQ